MVHLEATKGGQSDLIDHPLHGRSRHLGRPQGHRLRWCSQVLWFLTLPQEQIWSWISFDVSTATQSGVIPHLYWHRLVLEQDGDLTGIKDLILRHIPNAEQARLFGRELSYILPRNDVERCYDSIILEFAIRA